MSKKRQTNKQKKKQIAFRPHFIALSILCSPTGGYFTAIFHSGQFCIWWWPQFFTWHGWQRRAGSLHRRSICCERFRDYGSLGGCTWQQSTTSPPRWSHPPRRGPAPAAGNGTPSRGGPPQTSGQTGECWIALDKKKRGFHNKASEPVLLFKVEMVHRPVVWARTKMAGASPDKLEALITGKPSTDVLRVISLS